MSQRFKTPSRVSPQSNGRACLCDNGTYSKKCCDGSLWAQGIGNITYTPQVWSSLTLKWETINETYNELK